jgi:PadR family transcriptional regulator, regulatory protein PadR
MTFQLGATLLDACVLAVLSRGDAYGYNLTQQVKSVIDISESTLYPVLRRLQKENCLTTYEQQYEGRNRRYYRITDSGRLKLSEYLSSWSAYKIKIDNILTGEGGANQ